MAPVTSVQLYEKMKSKSPLCMRVESICHIFNLNNLQSLFSYLSEPFSCKNLASFGLYHHILEKKRQACIWQKDVVVIDDTKTPNMGHIARGEPPNITRKTQHLSGKLTESSSP